MTRFGRIAVPLDRAAGLESGHPSVDLLLRAIERRGWECRSVVRPGSRVLHRHSVEIDRWHKGRCRSTQGAHDDAATALALAFIAAVRASEGATE